MSVHINPGSGPVTGATAENAQINMLAFLDDLRAEFSCGASLTSTGLELDDGRWAYCITVDTAEFVIDMPGLPLDQVKWIGLDNQNIWDFPRLYVDSSSWVWMFAVTACDPSGGES